jgi:uncharacterized repeat protein (TIGR01451 family)
MPSSRERLWSLLAALGLSLLALAAMFALAARPQAAQAQGGQLGLEISKTLAGGASVRVGQVLEFTIRITNTGSLSITSIALLDTFRSDIVSPVGEPPYGKPGDPPLSEPPGALIGSDTISWTNVLAQPLLPGESVAVTVRLRAVRPTQSLTTVNAARIAEAIAGGSASGGGQSAEAEGRPRGATAPMTKTVSLDAIAVGKPVTYTIAIGNDGAADLTRLPLRDTYDASALQFVSADPPNTGRVAEEGGTDATLAWSDLLAGRGPLRPNEQITVTTVFIALRPVSGDSLNRAAVSGARDEYNNELVPRQADVPIVILPDAPTASTPTATLAPAPTATRRPTREAQPREQDATATASPAATGAIPAAGEAITTTAALTSTATEVVAVATPTMAPIPATLPVTGGGESSAYNLLALLALALLAIGIAGRLQKQRQ